MTTHEVTPDSGAGHRGHGHDDGIHHAHAHPASIFFNTLVALLILTILTVAVARFDFGSANMLVAMGIAAVKASLVMTFFMHLKWDTPMNQITIISSFIFLALLFIFTLSDFATRSRTDPLLSERAPIPESMQTQRLGGSALKHEDADH